MRSNILAAAALAAVAFASPAAAKQGDVLVRLRAIMVAPNESSGPVLPTFPGATVGVGKLASTWVLPPTLTLQYHFVPEGKVRPYVGAGVNWSIFYSDNASDELVNAVGPTEVQLSNSFGYALQAGVDFDLSEKVFLNLDVKYIDMSTKATLTTGALVNTVDVKINPLVFGIGLGMRF